jgi:hypothetical protein
MEKKQITEEMKEQDKWYEEAKKQTPETIGDFVKKLCNDYQHDYGTICHAVTAAAVGAAWAVENSPTGGITGFQGNFVTLQFMQEWGGNKPPFKITNFDKLLYPQYKNDFTSISKSTWEWLQKEAKKNLEDNESEAPISAHPDVIAHWQSIVDGKVPFGFTIRED